MKKQVVLYEHRPIIIDSFYIEKAELSKDFYVNGCDKFYNNNFSNYKIYNEEELSCFQKSDEYKSVHLNKNYNLCKYENKKKQQILFFPESPLPGIFKLSPLINEVQSCIAYCFDYQNKSYTLPDLFNTFLCNTKYFKDGMFDISNVFSPAIAYLYTFLVENNISCDYIPSFQIGKEKIKKMLKEKSIDVIGIITTFYISPLPHIGYFIRYVYKVKN